MKHISRWVKDRVWTGVANSVYANSVYAYTDVFSCAAAAAPVESMTSKELRARLGQPEEVLWNVRNTLQETLCI